MIPKIEPSHVQPIKHREPGITRETRPDPTDDGGSIIAVWVVNVTLACGKVALIDLPDFNAIMRQGFSNQWWLHSNGRGRAYVRTTRNDAPGVVATIGRLVTGGQFGTHVRYINKDPLDLRRNNLKVGDGASKGHEAAAMVEAIF